MKPVRTRKSNMNFVLEGGTQDNDLPAERAEEDGQPVLNSHWELDAQDRERIAAGGRIELTIWGTAQPPVALAVVPPECGNCGAGMNASGGLDARYNCPNCGASRT